MIDQDAEKSKQLLVVYLAISGLKAGSSKIDVANSMAISGFPGALVPASNDDSVVFVAAPSSAIWERVMPLLLARVGLTLSDFAGIPLPITVVDPVADFLELQGCGHLSQIRLGSDEASRRAAWAALARLVSNVEQYIARPVLSLSTDSASTALANFEFAAEHGNVTSAQQLLDAMVENRQIDALNRLFLQVRIFALAADWESIIKSGLYENLRHVRVPIPVKDALEMAYLKTSS